MTPNIDKPGDDWAATGEGWESAETNIGSPHDWKEQPELRAIYIERASTTNAEGEEFPIYACIDPTGARIFLWETPDLRHAFRTIPPGSQLVITHLGQEDIGKGRKINRFDVKFRPPVPAPAPPSSTSDGDTLAG